MKGLGLVEYALMLIFALIVIIVLAGIVLGINSQSPCKKTDPTAGDVVYCMATMTAEARHK